MWLWWVMILTEDFSGVFWVIVMHWPFIIDHCTMAQALKKFGIKDFAKMRTLAPIFSSQNYFRWKYLDDISFAVSLSIWIWVRVDNSLLQQLNCQRISCNSNRLQKGCESNWGDQLTRALKKQIQFCLPWSRLWKYLENICIFQM